MGQIKDMAGDRYGRWTVKSFAHIRNGQARWVCVCDCGNKKIVFGSSLQRGNTKSCGCLKIEKQTGPKEDISGNKYGCITVLCHDQGRKWLGKCSCGKMVSVDKYQLTSGSTQSCGCLRKETRTTHGMYGTTEYMSWSSMIQRCTNPNNTGYASYGGRSIKVCTRWLNSFASFYADMGDKPDDGLSIDRIDNNGNYEPGNCRWATSEQQHNNTRSNRFITYDGETLTLAQWARKLNRPRATIRHSLDKGCLVSAAFTLPVGQKFQVVQLSLFADTEANAYAFVPGIVKGDKE